MVGKAIVKTLTKIGKDAIYSMEFKDEYHYENWKRSLDKKGEKFIASLADNTENRERIR